MDIHSIVSFMPYMVLCASVLTPLQAIGILIWYVVREIIENEEEEWYKFSRASLLMVLAQVVLDGPTS